MITDRKSLKRSAADDSSSRKRASLSRACKKPAIYDEESDGEFIPEVKLPEEEEEVPEVEEKLVVPEVKNTEEVAIDKSKTTEPKELVKESKGKDSEILNESEPITKEKVQEWNELLEGKSAHEILDWAKEEFKDKLFQTTSFGLTGLVTIDLLKDGLVPLIFIDTLFNFKETIELIDQVEEKYKAEIHRYYPADCNTREEFIEKYGDNLWTADPNKYDFLVKAEPGQRAYKVLGVRAVLTGRRRSQGADRSNLEVVQLEESSGVVKINPLYTWSFDEVWSHIKEHNVPYNALHDQGYKSIGDYHSTEKTKEGEGERDGRWRGQEKTECGLHKDYFLMKKLAKLQNKS